MFWGEEFFDMAIIEASNLCKNYIIVKNKKNGLKGLIHPEKEIVHAVKNIDLCIEQGASVGFIGPNGAGKSTTIKMLTGILKPTEGAISVNGFSPTKQRKQYVKQIGVVFGNRSQLWWDLPARDSFDLFKEIYKIPDNVYKENLKLFSEILDLGSIESKPVRQMSLGQRMRCEIAASFLHNPKIVFLDEPTIGLDLVAKDKIREFLTYLNKEKGTTLLVTSHDMADIVSVCQDLIVIDKGDIVYQGLMNDVADIHGRRRFIDVVLSENVKVMDERIQIIADQGKKKSLVIDLEEITIGELIGLLSATADIEDIKISSTPIEDIIKEIYATSLREMKETSILAKSGKPFLNMSFVAYLKLVCSIASTRGSFLNFHTN